MTQFYINRNLGNNTSTAPAQGKRHRNEETSANNRCSWSENPTRSTPEIPDTLIHYSKEELSANASV